MPPNKLMIFDNILRGNIAYTNRELIKGEVRAVCLCFHAFGDEDLIFSPRPIDEALAEKGILSVFVFYDVWGFGNDITVKLAEALCPALYKELGLGELPLILFGEGVGATAALNCARRATSLDPAACVCACPVTDLAAHQRARGDVDAVYFTAFRHRRLAFDAAVAEASPILHTAEMKDIPYRFILPALKDEKIYPDKYDRGIIPAEQYDAYVEKMKNDGHDVGCLLFDTANCPLSAEQQRAAADIICNLIEV